MNFIPSFNFVSLSLYHKLALKRIYFILQEKIEYSFHPAIPLLEIFPKEIITLDTHNTIHYSIIC